MYLNLGILVLELVRRHLLKPGAECSRTVSSAEFKDLSFRQEGRPLFRLIST